MATLILGAAGALFGPVGALIGGKIGSVIDGALFSKSVEGPRLTELAVTTSSYGAPIPRVYGRMRVAGQIIWATDLVEHRDKHGNGKGKPSTVSYSYTASLAVAVSSRPIVGIGRIWADGKLLRGAAGDLKVGGAVRFHPGQGDAASDPLIAAAEGATRAPAFTRLAYAVFEDLQLADYGNRIPSLTFEVFADNGALSFQTLLDGVVRDTDAAVPLDGLAGISGDGPLLDLLSALDPLYPVDCDANGVQLTIRPDRHQAATLTLAEPATSQARDDFGGNQGFKRKRAAETEQPVQVLRYYDIDRDYQPGAQRAIGRPLPGQPRTVELPGALAASDARRLVDRAARRSQWARQTISWRVTEIDPQVVPGALVSVPGHPGAWRVRDWEWHEHGIDLGLQRLAPGGDLTGGIADPGRAVLSPDSMVPPTVLAAVELPWDGSASRLPPQLLAAASASGPGWAGAALYVDQGDGALQPLGPSGRGRATIGSAVTALAGASPLLFDRFHAVDIELVAPDLLLNDTTMRQLAMGANRAVLGSEIIQFVQAVPLGAARWRLAGLLRGRGGTESQVANHAAGERFILLDGAGALLDPEAVGAVPGTLVAALGLGDSHPVTTPIALRGIGLRPLSPVHGAAVLQPGGGLLLRWTRRARGGWNWEDGVDVPLNEQAEAWSIAYGPADAPLATWDSAAAQLLLGASELAALPAGHAFRVVQRGDRGVSEPLTIAMP